MIVTNMGTKPGTRAKDANESESIGHFFHSAIGRAGKSYIKAHGILLLVTS